MRAIVMMDVATMRFSNTLTSNHKEYKTAIGAAAAMVEEARRLLAQAEAEFAGWAAYEADEHSMLAVETPAMQREFPRDRWEGRTAR